MYEQTWMTTSSILSMKLKIWGLGSSKSLRRWFSLLDKM